MLLPEQSRKKLFGSTASRFDLGTQLRREGHVMTHEVGRR